VPDENVDALWSGIITENRNSTWVTATQLGLVRVIAWLSFLTGIACLALFVVINIV